MLKHRIIPIRLIKLVLAHSALVRDQVGNELGVLPRDYRVVQLELVFGGRGVLIVELSHLYVVSESVQGHIFPLCDSYEALTILAVFLNIGSQWLNVAAESWLVLQVLQGQARVLSVEELALAVEHSLSLISGHLVKEVGLIRHAKHLD